MNFRPFEWRDLPVLYKLRNQCLFVDSALLLTSGSFYAPAGALLSWMAPKVGVFTYFGKQTQGCLIGQATHFPGLSSARMSFLAPGEGLEPQAVAGLLEQIFRQVGERGALHLLADVNEGTQGLDILRQAGFGIYARQRIWRLPQGKYQRTLPGVRRATLGKDQASIRFLYYNLVPGLVQQVEPPPTHRLQGLVYYEGNELRAYLELRYGTKGIWAQPFVHPDAESVAEQLLKLLQDLPYRGNRPVYVCVRSYQSWLEAAILRMEAQLFLSQAVMVRHLAVTRKVPQTYALPAMNGKKPEPTVPVAHYEQEL